MRSSEGKSRPAEEERESLHAELLFFYLFERFQLPFFASVFLCLSSGAIYYSSNGCSSAATCYLREGKLEPEKLIRLLKFRSRQTPNVNRINRCAAYAAVELDTKRLRAPPGTLNPKRLINHNVKRICECSHFHFTTCDQAAAKLRILVLVEINIVLFSVASCDFIKSKQRRFESALQLGPAAFSALPLLFPMISFPPNGIITTMNSIKMQIMFPQSSSESFSPTFGRCAKVSQLESVQQSAVKS